MHVHMSERSVGQERAREAAHDWIRWQPCLSVRTYTKAYMSVVGM